MITIINTHQIKRAARSPRSRNRWLAILLAAGALSLVFAGPAAAGVGTGVPITLNTARWSPNAGHGSIPPTAYFDDYGIVHLWGAATQPPCGPRGCIFGGPSPNLLGTLPCCGAYTPHRDVFTIAHTYLGTYVNVAILTNGQIWLSPPRPRAVTDYMFVSLEGISYNPLNAATPIHLNGGWSPASVGSTAPAAYPDPSGTVHLQGAAVQTGSSTVLGFVPRSLAPFYNVYEIVATNNGTYADIGIDPSGQITLIGARLPAVPDYSFVSLEGISYCPIPRGGCSHIFAQELSLSATDWTDTEPDQETPLFGGAWAEYWEDSAGIVHLEGGIQQRSCCSGFVGFIANPLFRPSWDVFEIVHTFNGTYADIAILTDGSIDVIDPRPPAVRDYPYTYVSLNGITFAAPSPKFFGLSVRSTEKQGATITVTLRRPRDLALKVTALRGRRLVKLGVVHLGHHRAGRSQIHWNLRINGRSLPPGRYQVSLHALNGNILSVPTAPGPRTLVVLANGHVRVGK
ncbi:MAG: hypothetical protein JO168_27170 [Solirubrobacterales bacterium]|nr:hypothetical protein [Solirubrobacterales bacterium]